jgi:carboxyl-terminal processing protease
MKGVFFAFVRKFVSHQTPLSKKFIFPQEAQAVETAWPGKVLVGRDFSVDAAVIEDFRDYLVANKITVDAKKFNEAELEIKRELERELATALWGNEEGWKAFEKSDPVIIKALQAMPEAAKFVDR